VLQPLNQISFEAGHCPTCRTLRDAQFTHVITGDENFLHRTLSSVGVPPLHILRAQNGLEYRFYELTGDLSEALHFRHFEHNGSLVVKPIRERIRFKNEVQLSGDVPGNSAQGRVRLKEETPKPTVAAKTAAGQIKIKHSKKDKTKSIRFSEPKTTATKMIQEGNSRQLLRVGARFGRGRVRVCRI
jgi:hypothetical protein